MKTKMIIAVTGIFVAGSMMSCEKKYDDGPAISLRSKEERVANTWKIEKATRDGEDATSDYDEYTLKMTKDGDAELKAIYSWGGFSYEYETNGTWEFQDKAKQLKLDFDDDGADVSYQILRLAEKELWLREVGGEDELQLMPK